MYNKTIIIADTYWMFIVCHSPQGFIWILNPSTALRVCGGGVGYVLLFPFHSQRNWGTDRFTCSRSNTASGARFFLSVDIYFYIILRIYTWEYLKIFFIGVQLIYNTIYNLQYNTFSTTKWISHTYIHSFFFRLFPHIGHYSVLSRVPYSIQ